MSYLILCIAMFSTLSFAEVGKVSKLLGSNSYLMRSGQKIALAVDTELELGDEVYAESAYLVLFIYPASQVSLNHNASIKISEHLIEENKELEKSFSVIDYIKGVIRLQVTKSTDQEINQKVQANGVAFAVRGTEFEISQEGDEDVDLDVIEGEVEVTSPFVHTFVPEVVKANEGFRFNRKKKNFARRKFGLKFKNHPGFDRSERVRERWKELRKVRQERKSQNRVERNERRDNRRALKEVRKQERKQRKK